MPPEPSFPTPAADETGDGELEGGLGDFRLQGCDGGDAFGEASDDDTLRGGSGIDVLDLSALTQLWTIAIDGGPTLTHADPSGQYEDPGGVSGTIMIEGAGMLRFRDIERITW